MCQIGDIIVIEKYKQDGKVLGTHSFVVLEDKNGQIKGIDYDMVCIVLSSIKNEEQQKRKLSYPGNFPIAPDEQDIRDGGNGKYGYVKAEQFYYFNKDKIEFKVIGKLHDVIMEILFEFIEDLIKNGIEFLQITDNL